MKVISFVILWAEKNIYEILLIGLLINKYTELFHEIEL